MSKSLGNTFILREALDKYSPMAVRFFLLSTHYRKPVEVSEEHLEAARRATERIAACLSNVRRKIKNGEIEKEEIEKSISDRITEAMDDDFNTPKAIGIIFELVSSVNVLMENGDFSQAAALAKNIRAFCALLGLKFEDKEEIEGEILSLIRDRESLRQQKEWEKADAIRETLLNKGIILEDTPEGTRWRLKR